MERTHECANSFKHEIYQRNALECVIYDAKQKWFQKNRMIHVLVVYHRTDNKSFSTDSVRLSARG